VTDSRRVLLATDGSRQANEALAVGLRTIGDGASLVLATVVVPSDPSLVLGGGHAGPVMTPAEKQEWLAERDAGGRRVLEDVRDALGLHDVELVLLEGDAGRELCRYAEAAGVGLIVLGTSGKGGIKRAVLGSVSDHVVRNAPCPVLTIGPDATP
jgi:nucleotide-binding universal stress UspA family protein